jgi:pimeloyl-ACP methyl ester carboxylesterase
MLTLCVPAAPASAADEAAQNLFVPTADGWNIALTYYSGTKTGRESPVVVLLHMKGGNRLVWNNGFAKQLVDEGYAVIAVDLRGHGETKPASAALAASGRLRQGNEAEFKASDYRAMVVQDLEAVKQFIFEEHQREALNMRKMAIVAPEASAAIALNFAYFDWLKRPYNDAPTLALSTPRGQDVRALVLVSPDLNVPGMKINEAITALRNPLWGVSFYVGYGSNNEKDKTEADKLYSKLTHIAANVDRMYLIDYPVKLRGTDLFGQGLNLEANILTFLATHLKQLPDPWRDRKSVLSD